MGLLTKVPIAASRQPRLPIMLVIVRMPMVPIWMRVNQGQDGWIDHHARQFALHKTVARRISSMELAEPLVAGFIHRLSWLLEWEMGMLVDATLSQMVAAWQPIRQFSSKLHSSIAERGLW